MLPIFWPRTPLSLSRSIFFAQTRALHLSGLHLAQQSYYEDLGIHPQSSSKEIKDAFYKMSKEFHPDRNVDNPDALKKFQSISEAYDTLSTPVKRTKYDKGVLGRSSSVAEREASTHRFEGETFYGSRSNKSKSGDENPGKNLDAWVRDTRAQSFEAKHGSIEDKFRKRMHGAAAPKKGNMHDKKMALGGTHKQNQKTDQGIGFVLLGILFLIVVVRSLL